MQGHSTFLSACDKLFVLHMCGISSSCDSLYQDRKLFGFTWLFHLRKVSVELRDSSQKLILMKSIFIYIFKSHQIISALFESVINVNIKQFFVCSKHVNTLIQHLSSCSFVNCTLRYAKKLKFWLRVLAQIKATKNVYLREMMTSEKSYKLIANFWTNKMLNATSKKVGFNWKKN